MNDRQLQLRTLLLDTPDKQMAYYYSPLFRTTVDMWLMAIGDMFEAMARLSLAQEDAFKRKAEELAKQSPSFDLFGRRP